MIVVNRIGDVINVSFGGKDLSVMYSEEKFAQLEKIAEKAESTETMDNMKLLFEEVEQICSQAETDAINDVHPDLFKDPKTQRFHLRIDAQKNVISSVPMPKSLVRRIEDSMEKGIKVDPLILCWGRFLKNPKMLSKTVSKATKEGFANKFFKYIDMTYVMPDVLAQKLDEGYSEELAKEMATTYQVKITKEGLINCYKVSQEVDWKYEKDEDGEPVRKPRYERTFDPITGEIEGDSREDLKAEERIFIPAVMGTRGDKFYCEGAKGNGKLGHQIRVGATHRLPDWSYVDTNDNASCVKGLHIGGLYYIANYSGEIHNVFVDPMHIGAIPDDNTGAIRCIQYFVHSSLVAVNDSIYHSSKYAKLTDEQWEDMKKEILAEYGELSDQRNKEKNELESL